MLVEIERRGPDAQTAEALVVNATQDGNRISSRRLAPRRERQDSHRVLAVAVGEPRGHGSQKLNAEAVTGDGSIDADDLTGTIALNSGDGSIQARRVEGNLRARTGDGSIVITDGGRQGRG